jgi:choice-of-anchor B domain-containing protein
MPSYPLHTFRRFASFAATALSLLLGAALTPSASAAQQLYDFGTAFGRSTAVAGDQLLVAEPQNVLRPGLVYVFDAGAEGWREAQVVQASDAQPTDGFGRALAASGDAMVVGAPRALDGAGATYLFQRGPDGWRERARVGAGDGATGMGSAVALNAEFVAAVEWVGEREVVKIFRRSGDGGLQPDAMLTGRDGDARFGGGLAFLGDDALAVCGADAEGMVFLDLYVHAQGAWDSPARVLPGVPFSSAGGLLSQDPYKECAVSASGQRVLMGTPLGNQRRGAATVYRLAMDPAPALVAEHRFDAPAGAMGGFGTAVALAGSTAWVGAPNARGLMGAVARFDLAAEGWSEGEVIQGPGTDFMPVFGLSVASSDQVAVVGSPGDAYGAGVAVSFARRGEGWAQAGTLEGETEGYEAVAGEQVDCAQGSASVFGCNQVDLVSLLPVDQMGASRGAMVNDVWGWTDPETGREYAVVGRSDGTSFVDVTNPSYPVYLGQLPKTEGSRGQAWRDVKVIRDHAVIVADNAGPHGMQVFDMTRLRDVDPANPPTFEADALYTEIGSSHNLAVNEETGFAYTMANSAGGRACGSLHMIDMRDPKNPTFAGCYTDLEVGLGAAGQTHDAQCVLYNGPDAQYRGREICFAFSETAISIGDVTDKEAPVIISRAEMPNTAYIHQGWLTEDQRYLFVNDELDEAQGLTEGTRTIIWDMEVLDDPILAGVYIAEGNATDHNLYVDGNLMYQSNYAAGLRILDVSDPVNPVEVAYFDTAPFSAEVPGFFDGSWSNYPFFASGNILVTSHKQGLFLLKRRVPIS